MDDMISVKYSLNGAIGWIWIEKKVRETWTIHRMIKIVYPDGSVKLCKIVGFSEVLKLESSNHKECVGLWGGNV